MAASVGSGMAKIGAALIGVGRIGQVHLTNLVHTAPFQIRWLVDIKETHDRIQELVNKYRLTGESQITTPYNLNNVLDDTEVQVVIICVPTNYHEEVIMRSLKAGKHVFCEKPLAQSLESVKACYAEAKKQGRILFCAYNRRFDPQFRQIYDDFHAGKFGTLRAVKMTSHDLSQSLEYMKHNQGGIFLDMAIHDIDYICWLVGERPVSVMASTVRSSDRVEDYRDTGDYDSAAAIITFPSGVIGQLQLCRESGYGYDQWVEVLGTKRIARTTSLMATNLEVSDENGTNIGKITDSFITKFLDSFKLEMEHFLDVIQGKSSCDVTPESCILATEVSNLLTQAATTGQVLHIG